MRKSVILPMRNFQPEEAATAASSLKSNFIKNEKKQCEEKLSLCNFIVNR